jgi:hypothetical protein
MKQFQLLAVIAITLLVAASCVEVQKGKKKASKSSSAHAGTHAISKYLGVSVSVLIRKSVCRAAANALKHLSRRASHKGARHLVHLVAQCAAKVGRKKHVKTLRRAHRKSGKAKAAKRKRSAKKLRKTSRKAVKRASKARKGKKSAKKARKAAGSVLATFLRQVVSQLLH